jgi:hypothetical protein
VVVIFISNSCWYLGDGGLGRPPLVFQIATNFRGV